MRVCLCLMSQTQLRSYGIGPHQRRSQGSNSGPLVRKVSGLSTTPGTAPKFALNGLLIGTTGFLEIPTFLFISY